MKKKIIFFVIILILLSLIVLFVIVRTNNYKQEESGNAGEINDSPNRGITGEVVSGNVAANLRIRKKRGFFK